MRALKIVGVVVGLMVAAGVAFGLWRYFFPSEEWRVFHGANGLIQASLDSAAWREWNAQKEGDFLYMLGDEVCDGYFWGYDGRALVQDAWEADLLFFVDLEEEFACPVSEGARAVSRQPFRECPECVHTAYTRLLGESAGSVPGLP